MVMKNGEKNKIIKKSFLSVQLMTLSMELGGDVKK